MTAQPRNRFADGPYIQVAAFCERVLREQDGVISLVRVVDLITHREAGPDSPKEMPEVRFPLQLVLTLKSGSVLGRHEITIIPQLPSGETLPTQTVTLQFEGGGKGVNLIAGIDIPYRMEGLHWFLIHFDGDLFTKLPLDIRYSRTVTGTAAPGTR